VAKQHETSDFGKVLNIRPHLLRLQDFVNRIADNDLIDEQNGGYVISQLDKLVDSASKLRDSLRTQGLVKEAPGKPHNKKKKENHETVSESGDVPSV